MYATTSSGLLPYLIVQLVQGGDGLLPYLNRTARADHCQPLLCSKREGQQQITTYMLVKGNRNTII